MPVQHSRQHWIYLSYVPVCAQHWGVENVLDSILHASAFLLILCSLGLNGEPCSGPEAGECVCGQCRCRQEVNPEVSLNLICHTYLLLSNRQPLVRPYRPGVFQGTALWLCIYMVLYVRNSVKIVCLILHVISG